MNSIQAVAGEDVRWARALALVEQVRRRHVLVALFVVALMIRLDGIDAPPLDFQPTRQYHSALIAPSYYLDTTSSAPAWERHVADVARGSDIIEPPVMEALTAGAWHVLGGEHLWFPRLLSTLFWLTGGAFLYLLARHLAPDGAALFSLAFYLLAPFGLFAGRSFQPDPLMIMLMTASLLAIVRYHEEPSRRRLAVATGVSALALLVKPGIPVIVLFGGFAALAVARRGARRAILDHDAWIFVVLAALPTVVYYLYGAVVQGFLNGQAGDKVVPHLLKDTSFWSGWVHQVSRVLAYVPVVSLPAGLALLGASLYGVRLARPGLPKALLVGLWLSYIGFGLVFTENIHTHDYYSLFLIPLAALSLGPLGARAAAGLRGAASGSCSTIRFAAAVAAVAVAAVGLVVLHGRLDASHTGELRIYRQVGQIVHHSPGTVMLASSYRKPLEYHGKVAGPYWPDSDAIRAEQRHGLPKISVAQRFAGTDPAYHPQLGATRPRPAYFVVTDLDDLARQRNLSRCLFHKFRRVTRRPDFIVFDLSRDAAGERLPVGG